ncbi:MAG: saccharopine dehydrogenase NADP-binding domain-containing protein [Alphaproteobacteria bacterium]|nr:saccharopine dehydrogenase NADP-binding domain-containing protein [Alphaproteobacteria bacterium]
MMRVLIIGGYGNFGSTIARSLASETNLQLIIGGRSFEKAQAFCALFEAANPPEAIALDIDAQLAPVLSRCAPSLVIHTTGPFQTQDYRVAAACIAQGCHYVDLADARAFVSGIKGLDATAQARDVLVVSGASSVPCLTAALIDFYRPRFARLTEATYGISAAQQTNRGLATTSAVLSYVGKPFLTRLNGEDRQVFGWQDLHAVCYPELGRRWFGNCDIPDLTLFPTRYPDLQTIRFSAGHEVPFLHFGLWAMSGLVRLRLLPTLAVFAPTLLKLAFCFDKLGSSCSGFHMNLKGISKNNQPLEEQFFIVARSGHGPMIPCMPAILITKALAAGQRPERGARPCLDLIDWPTYRDALRGLDISVYPEE